MEKIIEFIKQNILSALISILCTLIFIVSGKEPHEILRDQYMNVVCSANAEDELVEEQLLKEYKNIVFVEDEISEMDETEEIEEEVSSNVTEKDLSEKQGNNEAEKNISPSLEMTSNDAKDLFQTYLSRENITIDDVIICDDQYGKGYYGKLWKSRLVVKVILVFLALFISLSLFIKFVILEGIVDWIKDGCPGGRRIYCTLRSFIAPFIFLLPIILLCLLILFKGTIWGLQYNYDFKDRYKVVSIEDENNIIKVQCEDYKCNLNKNKQEIMRVADNPSEMYIVRVNIDPKDWLFEWRRRSRNIYILK